MIVPTLFAYEFRNVLIVNERRGRLSAGTLATALAKVEAIPTQFDADFDQDRLLEIARRHQLSIYDAAYIELALRIGVQLATLDRKLAEAAVDQGVTVVSAGN